MLLLNSLHITTGKMVKIYESQPLHVQENKADKFNSNSEFFFVFLSATPRHFQRQLEYHVSLPNTNHPSNLSTLLTLTLRTQADTSLLFHSRLSILEIKDPNISPLQY